MTFVFVCAPPSPCPQKPWEVHVGLGGLEPPWIAKHVGSSCGFLSSLFQAAKSVGSSCDVLLFSFCDPWTAKTVGRSCDFLLCFVPPWDAKTVGIYVIFFALPTPVPDLPADKTGAVVSDSVLISCFWTFFLNPAVGFFLITIGFFDPPWVSFGSTFGFF